MIHTLGFLRERLDHMHERARFDLRHNLGLANALPEDAPALRDTIAAAAARSTAAPDAPTAELRAAAEALPPSCATPSATSRTPTRTFAAGSSCGSSRPRERIEPERSWHLPQGFDPDPGSTLPLAAALRP